MTTVLLGGAPVSCGTRPGSGIRHTRAPSGPGPGSARSARLLLPTAIRPVGPRKGPGTWRSHRAASGTEVCAGAASLSPRGSCVGARARDCGEGSAGPSPARAAPRQLPTPAGLECVFPLLSHRPVGGVGWGAARGAWEGEGLPLRSSVLRGSQGKPADASPPSHGAPSWR